MQPSWLLHYRPYRDSSQILDVLSRDHGRVALVARGVRGRKSKLRGVLRPFLPLKLSWVIRTDLGTLTGAEMHGDPISLGGDALLAGYYVNELVLNLLHRHDPQPDIHEAYAATIRSLAGSSEVSAPLRHFEMRLLKVLGYALNLDHDTKNQSPIESGTNYEYRVEHGAIPVSDRDGAAVYSGDTLAAIRRQEFDEPGVLRDATRLLRQVINFHLGGRELKSRKVLLEMRRATAPPGARERDQK